MAQFKIMKGEYAGECGSSDGPTKRLKSGKHVGPFGRDITLADGSIHWFASAHVIQLPA